jgi:hypothetical protein
VTWTSRGPLRTRQRPDSTTAPLPCLVFALAFGLFSTACEQPDPPSDTASSEDDSASATTNPSGSTGDPVWLEFSEGCTTEPWKVVEDGDEITMVLGGQGLLMFPMPLRAGGFDLPLDLELNSPEIPMLDFQMRVEGHNYGFNDTFARIPNYPVLFSPLENGDLYQFFYLTIFVPDEVGDDPQVLDGLEADISYMFEVPDYGTIQGGFTATIRVPAVLEADLDCGFG